MSNQRSKAKVHTRMKTITLSPVSRSFLATLAAPSPPYRPVSFHRLPSFPPHPRASSVLLPFFPPHPRASSVLLPSFPPHLHVAFPPQLASQIGQLSPVQADVLHPDYAAVRPLHSIGWIVLATINEQESTTTYLKLCPRFVVLLLYYIFVVVGAMCRHYPPQLAQSLNTLIALVSFGLFPRN